MAKIISKLNTKKVALIFATILLLFQFSFQLYLSRADSETTDEAVHLIAGYTYLTRQDFRFNPEHPPLIKEIAAIPLLVIKPNIPQFNDQWSRAGEFFYDSWKENRQVGEAFLYQTGNDASWILGWSRLMMIILTIILGVSIFYIAVKFWGWAGGLLALTWYVFDPNIAAHSHLITTDVGATLSFLWTIYLLYLFIQQPTWKRTLWLGFGLGIALLVKFTLITLIPIITLGTIYYLVKNKTNLKEIGIVIAKLVAIAIVSWFIIWAGYDFKTEVAPPTNNNIITEIKIVNGKEKQKTLPISPSLLDKTYTTLRPYIIPRDFFKGLTLITTHVEGGHSSFLLGNYSTQGWWYYFPVIFLLKTPIAVLIGLVMMLLVLRKNKKPLTILFFLTAALLYLLMAMTSKADLGLRHLFPIYPLIFISFGYLISQAKIKKEFVATTTVILIVEFASVFPNYFSFFNVLAGGPNNGYRVATDSNLDWGQDLFRIKNYLIEHQITNPYMEYFWDGYPSLDYLQISYQHLQIPPTPNQYLVIGASALQSETLSWVKQQTLVDRITPSVFLYRLDKPGLFPNE